MRAMFAKIRPLMREFMYLRKNRGYDRQYTHLLQPGGRGFCPILFCTTVLCPLSQPLKLPIIYIHTRLTATSNKFSEVAAICSLVL